MERVSHMDYTIPSIETHINVKKINKKFHMRIYHASNAKIILVKKKRALYMITISTGYTSLSLG